MRDRRRKAYRAGIIVGAVAGVLSGCSSQGGWLTTVGPEYQVPIVSFLDRWLSPLPAETAKAVDVPQSDHWWEAFADPMLLELQGQAQGDSPSLAQIAARIAQARAEMVASGGAPDLSLSAEASQGRTITGLKTEKQQQASVGLQMAWEIDLFGGVARSRQAATAQWRQEQDNWHAARLSLAVEVADAYGRYRHCQRLVQLAEGSAQAAEQSFAARQQAQVAGFLSLAELRQGQTAVTSARQAAQAQAASCQREELALARLTASSDPAALRQALREGAGVLPVVPFLPVAELPAVVLAQRPDVAAAERAVAAASAQIGVAEAARYPALHLNGSIAPTALKLGSAPVSRFTPWSIGPSVSWSLFDGGERAAREDAAQSAYRAAESQYRATVRQAVQEVEESLIRLASSAEQLQQARTALQAQQQALALGRERHRLGLLNAVELQALVQSALSAERELAALELEQWQSWISLYRAVGGDWQGRKGDPIPLAAGEVPPSAPEVEPTVPRSRSSVSETVQ